MDPRFDSDVLEAIQARYNRIASEQICPLHQKNASVVVAGENFNDLEVDVFTCCPEMERRVRIALMQPLYNLEVVPSPDLSPHDKHHLKAA